MCSKTPARWHRPICLAMPCRKASTGGRLCDIHQAELLAECTARFEHLGGAAPTRVAVDGNGYVSVKIGGELVLEHRALMELQIGRKLVGYENVHHKNGNRADNRLTNLELWVVAQPYGQRPADLVAYAHEILRRYGSESPLGVA